MAQTASLKKGKKKRWMPIVAPKMFNEASLGETHVYDPSQIMGMTITTNMMSLLNDIKKKSINLKFKVYKVHDGKGYAELTGYEQLPSSTRKFIRRGRDKIDDSFITKTGDDKTVVIKPLLLTNSVTKRSIQTKLRLTAKQLIIEHAQKTKFEVLIEEILTLKLQRKIRETLSKIYPMRNCEIRLCKIVTGKKSMQTLAVKKADTEQQEEKPAVETESVVKGGAEKLEDSEEKEAVKTEKPAEDINDLEPKETKPEKKASEKPKEKKELKDET